MVYTKEFKLNNLVLYAIEIIFGIVILAYSGDFFKLMAMLIGLLVCFYGVFEFIKVMQRIKTDEHYIYNRTALVSSVVTFVIGVLIIFFRDSVVKFVPILFGIYFIVTAIFMLLGAISLKNFLPSIWLIYLLIAIVIGILGVLIIDNPWGAIEVTAKIVGVVLLCRGIIDVIYLFIARKAKVTIDPPGFNDDNIIDG